MSRVITDFKASGRITIEFDETGQGAVRGVKIVPIAVPAFASGLTRPGGHKAPTTVEVPMSMMEILVKLSGVVSGALGGMVTEVPANGAPGGPRLVIEGGGDDGKENRND